MPGDSSWPFFKSSFPCPRVQPCECGCIHEDVLSIPFPSSLSLAFHPAMEQHRRCQTMFPGLKVDEFCVTIISCSQSLMEILLFESSEYFYFSRTVTNCFAEEFDDLVADFFLFFYKWLFFYYSWLVKRFGILCRWISRQSLVGLTIWLCWLFFSLELKLHKEWRAFHPYLIFSHSHRLNFRLEYSDTIN
jgi:hypothetical protein